MTQKVISVRIYKKAVADWLETKKEPGNSINQEINAALEAAMKKDGKK